MRKKEELMALLRGIVDLLGEESARNPEFAQRLEGLLAELPQRKAPAKKRSSTARVADPLPDIHAEWNALGETNFRLWLRDQPLPVLRAVIRTQDLDPTRRTGKWKEAEKLANFIADNLRARLSRGSAFMQPPGVQEDQERP